MNTANIIGFAGVVVAVLIPLGGGLWKLAAMLTDVRTTVRQELSPGNDSTKDRAREAAHSARKALEQGELLHRFIVEEVAKSEQTTAITIAQINAKTEEVERAIIDHGARVMAKHGEHDAQLRQLAHDVRNVRATADVLVHTLDLINQDRMRKEIAWYEAMRDQGFNPPTPSGIEGYWLGPQSNEQQRHEQQRTETDDGDTAPS